MKGTQKLITDRRAHSILVGIVSFACLFNFMLGFFRLGQHDFREDEFQVVDTAVNYVHNGEWYKWDWVQDQSGKFTDCITQDPRCHYTRAWPHTWLVAQSFRLFGISPWAARLVSVLFGVLATAVVFFVARFFTHNRLIAVLSSFSFALSPELLALFRLTRMYALLLPLFLLAAYFLYRGITETQRVNTGSRRLNTFFERYLHVHYGYLGLGILCLFLATLLHVNALILLPVLFVYMIYLALMYRHPTAILSCVVGIIGITLATYFIRYTDVLFSIEGFFAPLTLRHFIYLRFIAGYPFPVWLGTVALIGTMFGCWMIRRRQARDKMVYLSTLVAVALFFFIFVADRYTTFTYISHIVPFGLMLILYGMVVFPSLLLKSFPRAVRVWKIVVTVLVLSFCIAAVYSHRGVLYGEEYAYGRFSEAYQVIVEDYQPEQAVFAQYLRGIYVDGLPANTHVVNMLKNKAYTEQQFFADLHAYPSGWITWETRKAYHLRQSIRLYIRQHFRHVHGVGVDNTHVEVYYFDQSMVK
ncbi:MAG: glycosyltransferase family 39 protein [Candidatus Kerfeldbacteria bacterium]|nr:glycosyltransferase family 39 protein [Candidatus Kerfeldbacteria bacterium]